MMTQEKSREILLSSEKYKNLLYNKGFLITNDGSLCQKDVTASWERVTVGSYFIWHDQKLPLFMEGTLFLLGHAYNPYDMDHEEHSILKKLSEKKGVDFWQYEANLTGIYVMGWIQENGALCHWSDCSGMLISYYGEVNGRYYVTSHVNIVANKFDLQENPYITKLKNSRYFKLFGNVLPGDLSPYRELRRVVPNHVYGSDGSFRRFYPIQKITECTSEKEYQTVLEETATVLQHTMALCAQKWRDKRVAISVTGGKDSGVTLASANGVYDSFQYFSYISKPEEAVDAEAAGRICRELGLSHRVLTIPESNDAIPDFSCLRELVSYNGGNVGYLKSNEVRKRWILMQENFIDVEIKSWVDEISRAYYHKKYAKVNFPEKPTGRCLASLYKVFLENRLLLKQTADVFKDYIARYLTEDSIALVGNWLTLWSWEFGHSAGEGQHMTDEQTLSFDVTVPFNNRHLIATMLRPKLQDRINDRLQNDLIKYNNPKQAALGVSVVNAAHTEKRAKMERLYFEINSHSPF